MAQNGVAVFRDDSDPPVLGSARTEASVYRGASGHLRAETHTLDSFGISHKDLGRSRPAPSPRAGALRAGPVPTVAWAAARCAPCRQGRSKARPPTRLGGLRLGGRGGGTAAL